MNLSQIYKASTFPKLKLMNIEDHAVALFGGVTTSILECKCDGFFYRLQDGLLIKLGKKGIEKNIKRLYIVAGSPSKEWLKRFTRDTSVNVKMNKFDWCI